MAEDLFFNYTDWTAHNAVRYTTEAGDLDVMVDIFLNRQQTLKPTDPPGRCDRVELLVGSRRGDDSVVYQDAFEVPVTNPPRDEAALAQLAQRMGTLARSAYQTMTAIP